MLLFLAGCLFAKNVDEEPLACLDLIADDAFEPAPAGGDTQIHAASAFDGSSVWITWSEVHQGQFQVWAGRYACDGTALVTPMRLDDEPHDALDPSIAIHGDRVLVAWQHDNPEALNNLAVLATVLSSDGTVLVEPAEIVVERQGGVDNFWMPAVASTPDGFVLAGAAGIDGNFRVVSTALSLDADPVGPLTEPLQDASITQTEPELAVDAQGRVHLVFDGSEEGWYSFDGQPAESLGVGAYPSVAADGTVSLSGAGGLLIGPAEALASTNVNPGLTAVASEGGDTFVAWYRNRSGLDNELKVARVLGGEALGDRETVVESGAPPYGFNLTPVGDGWVFVATQVGSSPDFRLQGRFVRLPE